MNSIEAARKIDISAVRTHHSKKEIDEVIELGKKFHFINVHTLPCWTSYTADRLKDFPDVLPGAPVGFPSGGHRTETKRVEALGLIEDGVKEMDLVMNIGRLRNGEDALIIDEIKLIKEIAEDIPLKVIIEINCLTDDEMKKACELTIAGGADYVKTGTGWVPGDANLKRIQMMSTFIKKEIKIKAAGGIRTKEEFQYLDSLGVDRFGINVKSAVEIVKSFEPA